MELTTLISLGKAIGDGIVLAIIVVLYLMDRKKRNKEQEEDREELKQEREEYKDSYKKLVKDIIDGVNGHHLTPKESKSIAQIEKKINESIQEILEKTKASRVCIIKYHNGQRDMTGKSFLKMSMTNEVLSMGVAPMMSHFKDLFRSYLAYWCHELEYNGECTIDDVNKMQNVDINTYEYLKTRNIEVVYGIALKDLEGNTIGFLCVEYLDKKDFEGNNTEEIVKQSTKKIEALMTLNKIGGMENEL